MERSTTETTETGSPVVVWAIAGLIRIRLIAAC